MRKTFFILFAIAAHVVMAQNEKDAASIKAMCGCFDVSFKYAETFASDTTYKLAKVYKTGALEYVFKDEETPGKIILQHLLVINDSTIVKHWREDWEFQNTELFSYEGDRKWKLYEANADDVKGQWTQKVYEVNDEPRYSGSSTWIHVDGKNYWENTSYAPLPRREYTKRADYNILKRENRHVITTYGYLHEQDNQKIIRQDGKDSVLVQEKGLNKYLKTDDSQCKAAAAWWEKHKNYWRAVRAEWNNILLEKNNSLIHIQQFIDGKSLSDNLEELEAAYKEGDNISKQIHKVLLKHLD